MRRFTRLLAARFGQTRVIKPCRNMYPQTRVNHMNSGLTFRIEYNFSSLPKHQILSMPALSPTMSEGKVLKWNKNVGDKIEEGDIICQVETDKATVGFEATSSGFLAQKRETDSAIPVGEPLIVVVQKKDSVPSFSDFSFGNQAPQQEPKKTKQTEKQEKTPEKQEKKTENKQENKKDDKAQSSYPKHQQLNMPALSPTMAQGKIVKWNIKEGEAYSEGDSLVDIETDKATVAFEATQNGVLAKIIAKEGSQLQVGDALGISVKNKADVEKFKDYKQGSSEKKQQQTQKTEQPKQTEQKAQNEEKTPKKEQTKQQQSSSAERTFASPAAKRIANEKGINLSDIGQGSGPQGRILSQDVQSYTPKAKTTSQQSKETATSTKTQQKPQQKQRPQKTVFPENPFTEIPLNNMRKTIAARLTQSKTTIPHYYLNLKVEMDRVTALRNELNAQEKQNGVKISVNDIIIKAMALALRDYPAVNAQWHSNAVRQFQYADISVAVATEGGLITPIVYRADTLGLVQIAKRTKDVAKRAREGKLDPREYVGGTTTISNLGMFGINSVTSVINPPQSTILGVGKTEKQILFDPNASNTDAPYRVAEVMQLVVSADHRVVDGALASQWITRVKKYLQHPTNMLL